ncbi:BF3164 family lipoprotein [Belliella kenyensis]|uniref:BF3164 family lipoprotein n=1 Tax=Belliella kenyensis TaxID=1472724 RepID=A0ABV8EMS3_9BACT|nr:BF3164 family lipoprotein [Belliella kenyensis]MCH7400691.1 TolB-like 6-bladed beta-propeller domain-containing protein [Belliella kenyensis]MDN3602022.1 BF3164 family lipoprotein [Belliella kenyensis]
MIRELIEKNIPCFLKLSIAATILFSITSCKNNKESILTFAEEISIQGKAIEDIIVYSKKNVNLMVVDTFLVIQQNHEKILKVYSTNSFKLLGEYGNNGHGELDFADPYLLKQVSFDELDGTPEITLYDYQKIELNKINLLGMIDQKKNFHKQYRLEEKDFYYLHFYYDSPEFYLGIPEGSHKFTLYNKQDKAFQSISYTPELNYKLDQSLLYPIYRSAIAVNEKKQKIAAATLLIPNLELYNFHLERLKSIYYDNTQSIENALIAYAKSGKFDSKHYISELDSNEDYIFGLSYNNTSEDIYSNYSYSDLNFLVFDWEGNLITKYSLSDDKFIESFAVDFKKNKVYCYLPFEKDNNIYVYDLNNSPNN